MSKRERKKKERSYVPAQPGYSTVELIEQIDASGSRMDYIPHLRPIIAWELVRDADEEGGDANYVGVYPVTIEGLDLENPVVYPDGRVEKPYVYDYDSVDEWAAAETMDRMKSRSDPPSAPEAKEE